MALEIKKMKQGMSYSCKEKTIILNVFKYFRMEFSELSISEVVRRTAKATGCSEKSIFQFRKEESSVEGFKAPSTTRVRKSININSRDVKYDDTVRQAIRNIVYELKYKNIVPSLNTILIQVNENPQLPKFSLMTLRRLMFDMGFGYEKSGNKYLLVEKQTNDKKENFQPSRGKKPKKHPTCQEVTINEKANYSAHHISDDQLQNPIEHKYISPPVHTTKHEHLVHMTHNAPLYQPVHPPTMSAYMHHPLQTVMKHE